MALDLDRMLSRCRKGQWNVDDFDWTAKPAPMSKFDEMEVCQAFTNLIYIERIAASAFLEFSKTGELKTEREIFETFYDDEIRHAEAMFRLSNYFNQNNYKIYTPDPALVQFVRTITTTIKDINPEFASAMVPLGNLFGRVAGIMHPDGTRFREAANRLALLGKRNKAIARNRNYRVILNFSNAVAAGVSNSRA